MKTKLLIMAYAVKVTIGGVFLWLVRKIEADVVEIVLWLDDKLALIQAIEMETEPPLLLRHRLTATLITATWRAMMLLAEAIILLGNITAASVANDILRLERRLQPFRSAEIVVEETKEKSVGGTEKSVVLAEKSTGRVTKERLWW